MVRLYPCDAPSVPCDTAPLHLLQCFSDRTSSTDSTLTGIGPEIFGWVENSTAANDTSNPPPPTPEDAAFYGQAGFYITSSVYVLRPEVIESFYYAFRATGDQKYRDWAWAAFEAIRDTCVVGSGFAGVENVNLLEGGAYRDFQESFLFAETLKYAYLIHAPVRDDHSLESNEDQRGGEGEGEG